jgi:hypothetical protein
MYPSNIGCNALLTVSMMRMKTIEQMKTGTKRLLDKRFTTDTASPYIALQLDGGLSPFSSNGFASTCILAHLHASPLVAGSFMQKIVVIAKSFTHTTATCAKDQLQNVARIGRKAEDNSCPTRKPIVCRGTLSS